MKVVKIVSTLVLLVAIVGLSRCTDMQGGTTGKVVSDEAKTLASNPDMELAGQGLTLVHDAIGLEGLGGDTRMLHVDIGGPVQAAFLYWAGRDDACEFKDVDGVCAIPFEPFEDQVLIFDGTTITGDIVGMESQTEGGVGRAVNNIGYFANVTAIVQAKGTGAQSFTIADGNLALNLDYLNGAGLLVVFTDPSDPMEWRLLVYHGLDFAFGRVDQLPHAQVTEPIIFDHGATDADRMAELVIFAGDAEATRPDRIDVTDAFGTTLSLVNQLVGNGGPSWDTISIDITIPANGGTTTVQLFSEPYGENPDSLLWEVGALRYPVPSEPFCGNDVVDPGESCDGTAFDPTLACDSCRADCSCCGDGVVDAGEQCDDGNRVDSDGCRNDCTFCGDGIIDIGESCDGTALDPALACESCRADCTCCGDGVEDAGEQCDDGNNIDGDDCRSNCTLPSCGDGVLDSGESCDGTVFDPGVACDSCRNDCTCCGDGVMDDGEECDDGNNMDGDGCSASCTTETEDALCRVTGGGADCDDFISDDECSMSTGQTKKADEDVDAYTFGGQCGAPGSPFGEWTHSNKTGPSGKWTFHAGTHSAPEDTFLHVVECMDPPACDHAAANGHNKQIVCEGVGTFKNGTPPMGAAAGLHALRIRIVDAGEPGRSGKQGPADGCPVDGFEGVSADCDCPDYYHITIHENADPASPVIYNVRGYIRSGNLQMHSSLD